MIRILTRDDDIPSIIINGAHNLFRTKKFEVDIATAFVNVNGLRIIKDLLINGKPYLVTSNNNAYIALIDPSNLTKRAHD